MHARPRSVPIAWVLSLILAPALCTAGATDSAVTDLPLVTVTAREPARDTAVIILSGDGGWAPLDRKVSEDLARSGYPVVGLNSLKYFWTARTPEETADDLARVIRHTLRSTKTHAVALVGYSFGADVLPFLVPRLPAQLASSVRLVALIGAGTTAGFEFHLSNWLGGVGADPGLPVRPELAALRGVPVLCVYGTDEKDSLCRDLGPDLRWIDAVELDGGHHLGGDYARLATLIADAAEQDQTER